MTSIKKESGAGGSRSFVDTPTLKKPVFMDKTPASRGKTAKVGKTEAPFRPVFRVKRPFLIEKSAEFCGPLKKERTPPAKLNFSYMYKKASSAGNMEFFRRL